MVRNSRYKLKLEQLEDRRVLATFTVTNLNDAGEGSLRRAVDQSNAQPGSDIIDFDIAIDGGTIVLTSGEINITQGAMIDASGLPTGITIDASGSDATPIIDDGQGSRIFRVSDDPTNEASVELRGLTLTGGDVDGDGGAILANEVLRLYDIEIRGSHATGSGGGIATDQLFEATNSVLGENSTNGDGGGLFAKVGDVPVRLVDSTVTGNSAGGRGGGVFAGKDYGPDTPEFEILNSEIANNSSQGVGGGMALVGSDNVNTLIAGSRFASNSSAESGGGLFTDVGLTAITIRDSEMTGNVAAESGGAIAAGGYYSRLEMESTSIDSNTANNGGGLHAQISVEVTDSTFSNNEAMDQGGGINLIPSLFESNVIRQSTISGNSAIQGGGIWFTSYESTTLIDASTIIDNVVASSEPCECRGGGIYAQITGGDVTILHSTISENVAFGNAGAMFLTGSYTNLALTRFVMSHSTITGNIADGTSPDSSGGVLMVNESSSSFPIPRFEIEYSILANSETFGGDSVDLRSDWVDVTLSLIESPGPDVFPSGEGANLILIDPMLDDLADNGGNTMTHALLAASPVIDVGPAIGENPDLPEFDARGTDFARIRDGDAIPGARLDLGAFELQGLNIDPIANAGDDLSTRVGFPIQLDGSPSSDPDSGPATLTFAWSKLDGPGDLDFTEPEAAITDVTASAPGTYTILLTVSDGLASATDELTLTVVENQIPIADVSLSETNGVVGTIVILDGTLSTDGDGDPITFQWSLIEAPGESTTSLQNTDAAVASFLPDVPGSYVAELVVSDGVDNSIPVTVTVVVTATDAGWHNTDNPSDTSGDDVVSPIDALLVINELTDRVFSDASSGALFDETRPTDAPFLDVNDDAFIAPLDALLVINDLGAEVPPTPMGRGVFGFSLQGYGPDDTEEVDDRDVIFERLFQDS